MSAFRHFAMRLAIAAAALFVLLMLNAELEAHDEQYLTLEQK